MPEKRYNLNPKYGLVPWPYGQTRKKENYRDDSDKSLSENYAFYLDEDTSDITGYELLLFSTNPDNDVSGQKTGSINKNETVSFKWAYKFTSSKTFPSGRVVAKIWARCLNGTLYVKLYKRVGTTETLIGSDSIGINADDVARWIDFHIDEVSFNANEYLVVNIEIYNNGNSTSYYINYGTTSYDSCVAMPTLKNIYSKNIINIDIGAAQTQIDSTINLTINNYRIDIFLYLDNILISSQINWKPATYDVKEDLQIANKKQITGSGTLTVKCSINKFINISTDYWTYDRYHYYNKNPVTPSDFNKSELILIDYYATASFIVVLNDDKSQYVDENITQDSIRNTQPKCTKIEVINGSPTLIFKAL